MVGHDLDWRSNQHCYSQLPPVPMGATVLYPCDQPLQGHVVSVNKTWSKEPAMGFLVIYEVQVFGFEAGENFLKFCVWYLIMCLRKQISRHSIEICSRASVDSKFESILVMQLGKKHYPKQCQQRLMALCDANRSQGVNINTKIEIFRTPQLSTFIPVSLFPCSEPYSFQGHTDFGEKVIVRIITLRRRNPDCYKMVMWPPVNCSIARQMPRLASSSKNPDTEQWSLLCTAMG